MVTTETLLRSSAGALELHTGLPYQTLAYAFVRWRAEGLFSQIFHRCPDISMGEFLDWSYQPTVESVGCFDRDSLIGGGWIAQLYRVEGQLVAEVGAAFFKGTPLSKWRTALRMYLAHAFEDRGISRIYGFSSPRNRAARIIARCCGMHQVFTTPWGETPPDTIIWELRRENWRP